MATMEFELPSWAVSKSEPQPNARFDVDARRTFCRNALLR
jgi:hypothetical protein